MNQIANSEKKAIVLSNLVCLLSVIGVGIIPLLLWAHERNLKLNNNDFVYPIHVRSIIIFYWFDVLPKSGILLSVIWLCALLGFFSKRFSRQIVEGATCLLVAWSIVFGFFVWFMGETHFFENR